MEMMSAEISLLPFFVFLFCFVLQEERGEEKWKTLREMYSGNVDRDGTKKKKPGKKRIFVVFLRLSFERKENFFLKENF